MWNNASEVFVVRMMGVLFFCTDILILKIREYAFRKKNTKEVLSYQKNGKNINVPFMHRDITAGY